MAFNLTEVFTSLQKRIYNSDSDTNTQELLYFLKAALRGDQNTVYAVDTQADLPNLLDDSADTESTVYVRSDEKLYFKQSGQWKPLRPPVPKTWVGSTGGFFYGGAAAHPNIQYFPFTSPFTTLTNIGNLTVSRAYMTAARDYESENSYIMGGYVSGAQDVIERHPNADTGLVTTDVGNLSAPSYRPSATSSSTRAFVHMGFKSGVESTDGDSFLYASSVTSTDYFDIPAATSTLGAVTNSGDQIGYHRGNIGGVYNMVSYPFASSSPFIAAVTGASTNASPQTTGLSSETVGYWQAGGGNAEKFPFAAAVPITISTVPRTAPQQIFNQGAGAASSTTGYFTGNFPGSPSGVSQQFPFANDATVTTIGSVLSPPTNAGSYSAGSHF